MGGGCQILDPVLAPVDRAVEFTGERGDGQFLAVQRDLLAESAADIGADHRDLAFRQAQPPGQLAAQRVRRLVADVKRQMLAPGVPDGKAAAGFHWHMRMPVQRKACLDHVRRIGEGRLRVAGAEALRRDAVAGNVVVHQRRTFGESFVQRRHGRQRIIIHRHQFGGILGDVAIAGDDAGDGVALEPDLVDRQRRHRHRQEPVDGRGQPRLGRPLRQVAAGEHARHTTQRRGLGGIDVADAGVGVGRADEAG